MSEREGTDCEPVINGYQVLRDAPAEQGARLPRPAEGKLVIAGSGPALDGVAALRGGHEVVPSSEFLALLWKDRRGKRHLGRCPDGVLVMGCGREAPWLPEGWELDVFPAGLELPHLERWFAYALSMTDALADRKDIPCDSERGHPKAPQPRELVAHAHRIVRHLRLPNAPSEPRGPMTRAGCRAELEDVLQFLRQNVSAAPPAGAAGAGADPAAATIGPEKAGAKGKRINERMLAEIRDHPTESLNRSLRDWADLFGCSPSTVQNTDAWATLHQQREGAKLARQMSDRKKRMGRG
jgi:hypothetical protein